MTIEPDALLEMQYEEREAPTLEEYDDFWTNAREANDYTDEWLPEDITVEDGYEPDDYEGDDA